MDEHNDNFSITGPPTQLLANHNASIQAEAVTENQAIRDHNLGPNMDPLKLKRTLASREYSKKYRLRKQQQKMQLENEVKTLTVQVEINRPIMNYVNRQNASLQAENAALRERLSAVTGQLAAKAAHCDELRRGMDILKHRYNTMILQQQHRQLYQPVGTNPAHASYQRRA